MKETEERSEKEGAAEFFLWAINIYCLMMTPLLTSSYYYYFKTFVLDIEHMIFILQ